MDETTKSKKLWGPLERSILTGSGIDIGCGLDPISPNIRRFDVEHGDANEITKHVHDQFDFVYASHCLEHMHDPRKALIEWWQLVRVGGHLFFIVPDEDLYEQGVFPSRFNPDHKVTFTISKAKSWSPVSLNVLDLAQSLPNGQLVKIVLQDQGYDRRLLGMDHLYRVVLRVSVFESIRRSDVEVDVSCLRQRGCCRIMRQWIRPSGLTRWLRFNASSRKWPSLAMGANWLCMS
jgi:SAM-dependent methyltransferase